MIFNDDTQAILFLEERGITITRHFLILPHRKVTQDELDAIDELCYNHDYGYEPYITDEEMNIRIDVKLGYVKCDHWRPFNSQSVMKGDCGHEKCTPQLGYTRYTDHLNPCKVMEDSLTDKQFISYVHILDNITAHIVRSPRNVISAGPRDRCKAFLMLDSF